MAAHGALKKGGLLPSFAVRTLLPFLLSILFFIFFNLTKHHPLLRPINVFNQDPYDATSTFGIQLAPIAALMALFWARQGEPSRRLAAGLVSILAVSISLLADAAALVRFSPQWRAQPGGSTLFLLLLGMIFFTLVVCILFVKDSGLEARALRGRQAAALLIMAVVSLFILFFYPMGYGNSIPTSLAAVVVGMLLLFAPIHLLLRQLFASRFAAGKWKRLLLIAVLGGGLGLGLALLEGLSEGMPRGLPMLVTVLSIYIGLEMTGVVLGYFLLGDFLGLP